MRGLSKQQQPLRDEDADVCDTSSASCVSPAALLDAVGANLVCVSKSDGRVNVARTRELQPRAASSASATKSKTAKQRPDGRRESEVRFCGERNVPRRCGVRRRPGRSLQRTDIPGGPNDRQACRKIDRLS
eukprot:Selendium_serpulae@DN6351_c0_g4_i1.p4